MSLPCPRLLARKISILALTMVSIAATPLMSRGQEKPTPSLPDRALFYLATDDMHAFCQAWQGTALGRASATKEFSNYRRALSREQVGAVSHLRPWIGIDWEDLATIQNRVVLAGLPTTKEQSGVVVWIAGDAESDVLQNCLQAASEYWKANKFAVRVEEQGSVTLRVFERGVAGGTNEERFLASGPHGAIIATRKIDFQQLFKEMQALPRGKPAMHGATADIALQPFSLAKHLAASPSPKKRDGLVTAEHLGAQQIDRMRGSIHLAPSNEQALAIELRLPLAAPLTQAVRLLDMPAGEQLDPLPLAIAGIDTIGHWRWNSRVAMSAFGNLFDELVEPGPDGVGLFDDLIDGLREDPEGPQVDLRRELFDRIGPRIVAYGKVANDKTNERELLYVAECAGDNAIKVQTALERFFKNDRAVKVETIAAHHVWTVAAGKSLFVEVESADVVSFRAVAIGPRGFLVATHPELLSAALKHEVAADAASNQRWQDLLHASSSTSQASQAARVLVDSLRRLTPAYKLALAKGEDVHGWEPSLLRWLLRGDDYNGQKLQESDLPNSAAMGGFFLPLWLTNQRQPDALQLRVGMLDIPADSPSK